MLASVGANRSDAVFAIRSAVDHPRACAVDWMHRSERWNSIRYAIAAGVALTLYVQLAVNFVHPAPDTSEAPWRRHALLFWSEPATSIQTVRECKRARNAVSPAGASAMIPDDNETPQVRWYLRDFALTDSPAAANIVVTIGKTQSGALAGNPDAPQFGFEEWWTPDFGTLTMARRDPVICSRNARGATSRYAISRSRYRGPTARRQPQREARSRTSRIVNRTGRGR